MRLIHRMLATTLISAVAVCFVAAEAVAQSNYANAVLQSNPVAYWRLNETVGPTAFDAANAAGSPQQGAQNGTYTNFAAPSTAQSGLGFPGPRPTSTPTAFMGFEANNFAPRFDPTDTNASGVISTGDLVVVPDSSALSITGGGLTLEAWINLDQYNFTPEQGQPGQDGAGIVSKYRGVIDGTGASVNERSYSLNVTPTGQLSMVISQNGLSGAGNTVTVTSDELLPLGTWAHVAGVWTPGNSLDLYLNGVLIENLNSGVFNTIFDSNAPLWLGAQFGAHANDYYLDGFIDEAAVYNRALSADEIQAHFNAGLAVPEPSSLAALLLAAAVCAAAVRMRGSCVACKRGV